MMTKTCTKCGEPRTYGEFSARSKSGWRGTDGVLRSSWCKFCVRERVADWKAKHQTRAHESRWADAVKAKKQRVKDAVFAAYGGYVCACCGEKEPKFLSLDHVHNDGAKWRKETLGSRLATGWQTYRWLLKHGLPAGYQVLCMNCNFGKRMNGGVCPHQVKRNDYPLVGVGSSEPKRTASAAIH